MLKQSWVERRFRSSKVDRILEQFDAETVTAPKPKAEAERLVSAAIVRDGKIYGGFKSHAQVRDNVLNDEDPYTSKPTDQEGFVTSTGRFLPRDEALMVAIDAGQVPPSFNRELLSSDIKW
jgi:hypothetical protein